MNSITESLQYVESLFDNRFNERFEKSKQGDKKKRIVIFYSALWLAYSGLKCEDESIELVDFVIDNYNEVSLHELKRMYAKDSETPPEILKINLRKNVFSENIDSKVYLCHGMPFVRLRTNSYCAFIMHMSPKDRYAAGRYKSYEYYKSLSLSCR